jgi:CRP-like cAMP-binding protein
MADADYQMSARDRRLAGLSVGAINTVPRFTRRERRRHVAELASFGPFRHCTRRDLNALVARSVAFSYPADWAVISEATPADACYVISAGTAKVYKDRTEVAQLGRGDVIGDVAVLTGVLRPVTVTTCTRITGLRIDNEVLRALFDRRPTLRHALRSGIVPMAVPAARAADPTRRRRGIPHFWWAAQVARDEAAAEAARSRFFGVHPEPAGDSTSPQAAA